MKTHGLEAPGGPGQDLSFEMMALLKAQCEQYTGGQSTSVRADVARQLLESILYVLRARYEGLSDEQRLAALCARPLAVSYREGLSLVRRQVQSAHIFYRAMAPGRVDSENQFYRDTLLLGIPAFFQLYRPDLFAQELHITADYPVLFYPDGLQGIACIRAYLSAWKAEDKFMGRVDPLALKRDWALYAIHYAQPMESMHCNLFSIALAGELARVDGQPSPDLWAAWRLDEHTQSYVRRALHERRAELAPICALLREAP